MTAYQPKTGATCSCKPGQQRDNCPACEGTGFVIDFAAIRAKRTETRKTLKQLAAKVHIDCRFGANLAWDKQDEWQQQANGWRCTLRYQGRRYSFDFWQGSAISGEPTADGCLECLLSDASAADQDFESWAGDMGADTDSRKAEATYKACVKVGENMRRLLGDDFNAFMESER